MEHKTIERVENSLIEHPPYTLTGISERLFVRAFRSFVYNQMWEDPRIDIRALRLDGDSRILTICSAGCNVMNYLVRRPAWITAVDLNPHHIHLARLKLACAKYLPNYEDFWSFFGVAKGSKNLDLYRRHVRRHLDDATRSYWDGSLVRRLTRNNRIRYFKEGFYRKTLLGRLIGLLNFMGEVTVGPLESLREARTLEEQEAWWREKVAPFFDKKIVKFVANTPLWTIGMGIPPCQREIIEKEIGGSVTEVFLERSRRLVAGFPLEDNYFTWQALLGGYDAENRKAVPAYLRPENYDTLKAFVDRVDTQKTLYIDHLQQQQPHTYNRFALSDSMDWMKPPQIAAQWEEIARVGEPGSRIVFRTGASQSPVETALPPELKRRFRYKKELSEDLHRKDRAAVYGGFHCYVLDP